MAIAFVQSGTTRATGAVSKAFTSNNTAGNLIVVGIVMESSTDTIASVTDTRGNTYAIAGVLQGSSGGGYEVAIYYAKNIAVGANTVTVTPTTGTTQVDIAIHEYSGADTTAPLDQTASATAISAAPSSGSVTTTAANELIFGVINSNLTVTRDASLTTRHDFSFNFFSYSVDKIGATAGSYQVNGTQTSNRWVANVATFKESGTGPPPPPPQTYLDFVAGSTPTAVVLAEIQPAEQLGTFTLDSGVVYKITWPKIVQTALVAGGLYRRLDFVRENATTYTSVGSIAACQAAALSFFYDSSIDTIYVHTSSGSSPNTFAFIGAWFSIFVSTTSVSLSTQPLYLPLISGLPTLDAEMPDPLFGSTISETGELALSNTDGLFDKLTKSWIWRNKRVTFCLGSPSLAYADFARIAVMRINGVNVDDEALALQLEDMGSILNHAVPEKSWAGIAAGGNTGSPQQLVFGAVSVCPGVFLGNDAGTNRDFWAYYDFGLNNVTVGAVAAIQRETGIIVALINGTHYSVDVTTGFVRVTDPTYFSSNGFDIVANLTDSRPATFGSCAHRLLNLAGELDANIDLAAFTAADVAAPQLLSRYVNVSTSAADLMRELEQSCLGQVYRGTDGRWTCRVLDPSLPASATLSDADFVQWETLGDLSAVLNEVRVRYNHLTFTDEWSTTSASSSDVQFGRESFDSHQIDTWIAGAYDAGTLASHLLFWYSAAPSNISFEERGISLMQANVGDLIGVTRDRAPVARTGRYDGQLLRILKLTKSLNPPSVSGVLGDLSGQSDRIARVLPAGTDLAWSAATTEQRALYGFLSDTNGYIDSSDGTTRFLKVTY